MKQNKTLFAINSDTLSGQSYLPDTDSYSKENVDPCWITGITDAEGNFSIIKSKNKNPVLAFKITQSAYSIALLTRVKDYFRCGRIVSEKNKKTLGMKYTITNLKDLILVINHFDKYPLQSSKVMDYMDFRKAYFILTSKNPNLLDVMALKNTMNKSRDIIERFKFMQNHQFILTSSWIQAFIDGEGCFYCFISKSGYKVQLTLEIAQSTCDRILLNEIINYFKQGYIKPKLNTSNPESANLKSVSRLIITNVDSIVAFFDKYPLYSRKALDYADWKIIAALKLSGVHKIPHGIEILSCIKSGMNSKRSLNGNLSTQCKSHSKVHWYTQELQNSTLTKLNSDEEKPIWMKILNFFADTIIVFILLLSYIAYVYNHTCEDDQDYNNEINIFSGSVTKDVDVDEKDEKEKNKSNLILSESTGRDKETSITDDIPNVDSIEDEKSQLVCHTEESQYEHSEDLDKEIALYKAIQENYENFYKNKFKDIYPDANITILSEDVIDLIVKILDNPDQIDSFEDELEGYTTSSNASTDSFMEMISHIRSGSDVSVFSPKFEPEIPKEDDTCPTNNDIDRTEVLRKPEMLTDSEIKQINKSLSGKVIIVTRKVEEGEPIPAPPSWTEAHFNHVDYPIKQKRLRQIYLNDFVDTHGNKSSNSNLEWIETENFGLENLYKDESSLDERLDDNDWKKYSKDYGLSDMFDESESKKT